MSYLGNLCFCNVTHFLLSCDPLQVNFLYAKLLWLFIFKYISRFSSFISPLTYPVSLSKLFYCICEPMSMLLHWSACLSFFQFTLSDLMYFYGKSAIWELGSFNFVLSWPQKYYGHFRSWNFYIYFISVCQILWSDFADLIVITLNL